MDSDDDYYTVSECLSSKVSSYDSCTPVASDQDEEVNICAPSCIIYTFISLRISICQWSIKYFQTKLKLNYRMKRIQLFFIIFFYNKNLLCDNVH